MILYEIFASIHLKGIDEKTSPFKQNMYFYIAYNQSADKNTPHPPKIVEIVFARKKGQTAAALLCFSEVWRVVN